LSATTCAKKPTLTEALTSKNVRSIAGFEQAILQRDRKVDPPSTHLVFALGGVSRDDRFPIETQAREAIRGTTGP
jgi:hypothetical protein